MKRYRPYTAKKFKLAKRIVFFVVVAVIIFVLTVIVGNRLKDKLENADIDTSEIPETTAPDENDSNLENQIVGVEHDPALADVRAGYLDLSGVADIADARSEIDKLKGAGYNAVSFVVTDGDGKITYCSPAVEKASRLPADKSLVSFEVLSAAVSKASDMGMRAVAVMTASDSFSDGIVAGELSQIGFDEIVVRGFEKYTQIDNSILSEIKRYTDLLRGGEGGELSVGVCFTAEFYLAPYNAPYIEKLYAECEFLSIDMTGADANETARLSQELAGSFSAYLLRPVLSGENEELRTQIDGVFSEHSIKARQYISAPPKPVEPDSNTED